MKRERRQLTHPELASVTSSRPVVVRKIRRPNKTVSPVQAGGRGDRVNTRSLPLLGPQKTQNTRHSRPF